MLLAEIGMQEILIVAVVIILLFGASALPKMARSIGQSKSEFEKGIKEGAKEDPDAKPDAKPEDK